MVQECHSKEVPYKVLPHGGRDAVKKVPYTVCKPVHYTKTIQVSVACRSKSPTR